MGGCFANYYYLFLFRMVSELMAVSEQVAEPWVAMGYYCLSTKKATRAVYFAQKVRLP